MRSQYTKTCWNSSLYPHVADLQLQVIFQQDGAPPHWSLDVRNSLTESFSDRWIGCSGPICWPPHWSDFFPCGYVKDLVFATPVQDLHDLRTHILDTIARVQMDILDRTWHKIKYRLDIVRATNGAHIVVLCVCVCLCARARVLVWSR